MLKHLLLGAVATTALAMSGAANAAITITDLGQANPNTTYPLLSANTIVLGVNNAPVVFGGGDNNGTIQDISAYGSPFLDPTTYTDGTTGWNPFGTNSQNYWISIAGSGGAGFNNAGASSVTLGFGTPQYSLQFVWGSPSYNNSVTLYNGATAVGTVQQTGGSGSLDIFDGSNNYVTTFDDANLQNTDSAGQIINIASDNPFTSAVLASPDNTGGFEVGGVSAVPLPGAMPMFGAAVLGLGMLARRRKSVIA